MHRTRTLPLRSCLAFAVLASSPLHAFDVKPGAERWPIKTTVRANAAVKTIALADLILFADPPGVTKNDRRYQSERIPAFDNPLGLAEGNTVRTFAWLHLVASEGDGDYHVQVSASPSSGDNCLIVEVPKPDPKFVASAQLRPKFEKVRAFIRDRLLRAKEPSATGNVMVHPVYVMITGPLFYDDAHVGDPPRGKKGMHAATLWELHPVTDMAFAVKPNGH